MRRRRTTWWRVCGRQGLEYFARPDIKKLCEPLSLKLNGIL